MRITMIDNFDSFTFNLVDYLKQTGTEVKVYRNTVPVDVVAATRPDLVVYSPGPGRPAEAGHLLEYMKQFSKRQVPQFGVCLGLQGLIEAFGGTLRVLAKPVHGKASLIAHDGQDIFAGLPNPFAAGRYHSLAADTVPDVFTVTATTQDNGDTVVMAIRHNTLPIRAVQFHPESILTFQDQAGLTLMHNVVKLID